MPRKAIALSIAGLLFSAICCDCVRAEVSVQGQANDVRVEANDASLTEILAALGERFGLRYRGAPGTGGITARFEGSLRQVVARVLAGYNFVIADHRDGIEVIVLGAGGAQAVPAPAVAPPTYPSKINRRD